MQIAISGKFSDDVADAAALISDQLRGVVTSTDISDVPADLSTLVFFPVIVSDDLGISRKSHRSFSSTENAEFVNVEIPYSAWVSGVDSSRLQLMFEGLKKAIGASSRVSPEAAAEVIHRLELNLRV